MNAKNQAGVNFIRVFLNHGAVLPQQSQMDFITGKQTKGRQFNQSGVANITRGYFRYVFSGR